MVVYKLICRFIFSAKYFVLNIVVFLEPESPSKVEVTDRWPSSSSVRVKWEPPAVPNGIITKYKVNKII